MNEESVLESEHRCHIVQLIPYQHQVGGHVGLLTYDEETICKPLNEQECKVYRYLPEELKEFIPEFCGIVKVHFEKCGDDILCFALPPDCSYCEAKKKLKSYLIATKTIPFSRNLKQPKPNYEKVKNVHTSVSQRYTNSTYNNTSAQEELHRRWQKSHDDIPKLDKFIKLECASKHFKFPCIIDLKMGTQGHGDFASKEKKERKEKRIQNSTSSKLGVRLCGMQVYHISTGRYTFVDKYEGRRFTVEEFKNCLRDFLYNGKIHRIDLIELLTERLEKLVQQLKGIEGYRFYCSSLLLLYDGYESDQDDMTLKNNLSPDISPKVEVRMIDFANARLKEEETNTHIGPDSGYIFGVTSLIDIFNEIKENFTK